jgi:hypothetical protein
MAVGDDFLRVQARGHLSRLPAPLNNAADGCDNGQDNDKRNRGVDEFVHGVCPP